MKKPIYTVTMLRYAAGDRCRCVGFYFDLDIAISEVKNNSLDIHECDHHYCVIEEVTEGFYCYPRKEIWFKWHNGEDGYIEITKPDHLNKIVGFGMG